MRRNADGHSTGVRSDRSFGVSDTPMRKIIVEAEVSIDGAMGGENAEFWKRVFPLHSPDVQQYLNDLLFMPDALLLGQRTFSFFASVWPTRPGREADRINAMPKYVASRTLKEQPGGPLLQYGIGALTHTMLTHGLVDELRLLVYPFAFGDGPRIFDHMGAHTLKLLETRTFDSGVVALHYQVG